MSVRNGIATAIDSLRPELHTPLARLLEDIASHPEPGKAIQAARDAVAVSRPPEYTLDLEDEDFEKD